MILGVYFALLISTLKRKCLIWWAVCIRTIAAVRKRARMIRQYRTWIEFSLLLLHCGPHSIKCSSEWMIWCRHICCQRWTEASYLCVINGRCEHGTPKVHGNYLSVVMPTQWKQWKENPNGLSVYQLLFVGFSGACVFSRTQIYMFLKLIRICSTTRIVWQRNFCHFAHVWHGNMTTMASDKSNVRWILGDR